MKLTILRKLTPALLGLACVCAIGTSGTAQAQRVPSGTNEIAFSDFDNYMPSGSYGYWYSGPTDVSAGAPQYFDRYYIDEVIATDKGPQVGKFTFDATQFAGTEAVTSGWWGAGFGGVLNWTTNVDGVSTADPALFISQDPADYILSFDAKAEGMLAGQAANSDMEFRIGTGGGSGWVLVKAIRYHPGTNWTHFRFSLDEGNWISADQSPTTSLASFTNAVAAGTITTIAWNQNQPNPSQFGYDGDNSISIDNVKLEVLRYAGPPPPPPPKQALAILDYNFDDKPVWWVWPEYPATTTGWSANANKATYWGIRNDAGAGRNGSNGFSIGMDNSGILADPAGKPAWAGGNASTGGAGNYSLISSPNLKDYQYNFWARAEGLAEGQESTSFVLQLIVNAPDNTLQPSDTDTNRDMLIRLNLNVSNVKSEWQNFVLNLKDASIDSGSLANFTNNYAKVDEIQFQLQIQNPHQDNVWGLDANNKVTIDDFQLQRLVVGNPPVTAKIENNQAVITWTAPSTGTVKLLSGSTPTTITTEVPNATSPYKVPADGTAKFFRTLWVAPTQ